MSEAGANSALVLFSGGQDSTVCLAWALTRYDHVETVGFRYGQRHDAELAAREAVFAAFGREFPQWAAKRGEDHAIEMPALGRISETALTRDTEIKLSASGLPNTFVPGRNILFFTYAAAIGYRRGLTRLVGGMCETDYSGYPDCRNETLTALAHTLQLGTEAPFRIETPLMWRDKSETWALGQALGGDALTRIIVEDSHTCYFGVRDRRHDWGAGCGECPACQLRAAGYAKWRAGAAPKA
ncbi:MULTISPECIES: 7-cyano-7-deazaguanine synthase QueC [Rhodomicrobium]|uniref:7-cyano-7-deazaguanine synthase QueC n=1 Tax=Rhodomicrobium TaxID=1068 RepID=UPI000B4B2E46|nr:MULTISPECIES: 7-cyano-7-deazaguanine synthase QueC [Rhodomicrobium]